MFYRSAISGDFDYIEVKFRHTSLLCGYRDSCCSKNNLRTIIEQRVETLYSILEQFNSRNHGFFDSLNPMSFDKPVPELIGLMNRASEKAGVGPMASVAGLVSDEILKIIMENCSAGFVENGGDVAVNCDREMNVTVFPGWGDDSAVIGFRVPAGTYGITTSSGRYGPSFSEGEADMVSVASDTAAEADAFSTSIGNRIVEGADVQRLIDSYDGLRAVAVMWKGQIWYKGDFELIFL